MHGLTCHTHKHGSATVILFLPCLITNKSNISSPQYVKGGASASLCMGRSAIFCSPGLSLSLWHFTHLNKKFLTAALQLVIQHLELLSSYKVAPLPPWAHLITHCYMIKFDSFSPFGKMIWCMFSSMKNDLFSWPLRHIIPILFKDGSYCLIIELLGIVTYLFPLLKTLSPAENLFSLANLIN